MLFSSEFSSFAFVIGRTTLIYEIFSLVTFHHSRFLLANEYLRIIFTLFFYDEISLSMIQDNIQ